MDKDVLSEDDTPPDDTRLDDTRLDKAPADDVPTDNYRRCFYAHSSHCKFDYHSRCSFLPTRVLLLPVLPSYILLPQPLPP